MMSHKKRVTQMRASIAWMRQVVVRFPFRQAELDDMIADATALDPRAFRKEAAK